MKCFLAILSILLLSSCAVYKDKDGGSHLEILPPPVAVAPYPAPPPPVYYYPGYYYYYPRGHYYR
jgi:hypothetical protein